MNVSRRDFLKGSAAVLGASVVGSFGFNAFAEEAAKTEAAPIPDQPVDGRWITRAIGHESWIYVATTFKGNAITACSVVRQDETIGVGNYAVARIPAAILANQSINVPNVRGCSITSAAIKNAVKDAIIKSGRKVEDYNAKIEREMTNEIIERDCDIVVVGAGTAGLVAGARLAEKGLNVVVVEKRDIPGGSAPMTYSGLNAVGARRQLAYDVDGSLVGTASVDLDAKIESLKAQVVNPERASDDMPHMRVMYQCATELGDWLSDIGVGFKTFGNFEGLASFGSGLSFAPGMYMGGIGYATMLLAERIDKHENAEIIYATRVTDLIQGEDGRVTGVHAEGENGNKYTLNAKAVCLASGGFGRNADMVKEYNPEHVGQFFNGPSGAEGDGIRMGIEAGSEVEVIDTELPAYLASKKRMFELAFLGSINGWGTTSLIFVNAHGDNIGSALSHSNGAIQKLNPANGNRFFCVFDEQVVHAMHKSQVFDFTTYAAMFECDDVVHYDSVEAAVKACGTENLQATIDAYNETGYIETRDGIWVLEVDPNFYISTSGLKSDTDCHILNKEGNIIPGLYGAGDVTGSPEKKDGLVYGYGFDAASSYGYHMAEVIGEELA